MLPRNGAPGHACHRALEYNIDVSRQTTPRRAQRNDPVPTVSSFRHSHHIPDPSDSCDLSTTARQAERYSHPLCPNKRTQVSACSDSGKANPNEKTDGPLAGSAIGRATPEQHQRKRGHPPAAGKENRMRLNEWQPLRAPAPMPKKNAAARRLLPTQISMELNLDSGKPDDPAAPPPRHCFADAAPAAINPLPRPLPSTSLAALRPVRGQACRPPAPPAARAPHHRHQHHGWAPREETGRMQSERSLLNKTWPKGREAWSLAAADAAAPASAGSSSEFARFAPHIGTLSASAPSLGSDSDKLFARMQRILEPARLDDTHLAGRKEGRSRADPLALSLPSVVQLPSIAEESQITATRKGSIQRSHHRRKLKGAPLEHGKEERISRRPRAPSLSGNDDLDDVGVRKPNTQLGPWKTDNNTISDRKGQSSKLKCILPQLTASTPYLTATGLLNAVTKHLEVRPPEQLPFDNGDPDQFLTSDTDTDMD